MTLPRHTLGSSDLEVTDLCLGTMTFGNQTPEADAHSQLDRALEAGINFLDTAEMYPVNPISAETVGLSERIIGNWIAKGGNRDGYIIATKMSGKNGGFVRDGRGIHPETLADGLDGSLRRLGVDCIDLYQFHWPNRGSYHFRQNWTFDPGGVDPAEVEAHMVACLDWLAQARKAGKIRHFGLSNESAWGTGEWLRLARLAGAPEPVAIQNEYSLMCRLFDTDLSETCVYEKVGLLAFSPLAAGLLTGKYADGTAPEGSRLAINGTLGGRWTDRARGAAQAYVSVAQTHGLDPVHMALAWCATRPFMGSAIFGATTLAQLERILAGADLVLPPEVVAALDAVHKEHPMPY
jgi:aryl-alcohol dehydrogenase-like predicted oxidoreductase